MKLGLALRRFAVPSFAVTIWYLWRSGSRVSPRAEVDLSPLIEMGRGTDVSAFVKIKESGGPLTIGRRTAIATGSFISASEAGVRIGDCCMIGPNATIAGNNYRYDRLDLPVMDQPKTSRGITIESDVWVGAGAVVLDGAFIESGVIIAPNAVVSGRIPRNSIVQGNPAKVIFTRR